MLKPRKLEPSLPVSISRPLDLLRYVWSFRSILLRTSRLELSQRYAGSFLGWVWVLVYPVLFLSIYIFLYLVVFQIRFPSMSSLGYVVYVFAGLVPYLVIMESVTRGALVIRENIHLIRNVIIPVELVPVRLVIVSFMAQLPGFALLLVLVALDRNFGWRIVLLPVALALLALMLVGIVFMVSSVGVLLNDTAYITGLVMLLLMFLSPIAFEPSMVPANLQAIVYLNPVSYPLEGIRWTLLDSHDANTFRLAAFPLIAIATFVVGTNFFARFKGMMADNV